MANEGLGTDNAICAEEFIEAVRAQLLADNPGHPEVAAKVDQPLVQKNFAPLAQAVFRIATARAQVRSGMADDAEFWTWVAVAGDWLADLANWQQAVTAAFEQWIPVASPEQALRGAVLAAPSPGTPPLPPTTLTGRVE